MVWEKTYLNRNAKFCYDILNFLLKLWNLDFSTLNSSLILV